MWCGRGRRGECLGSTLGSVLQGCQEAEIHSRENNRSTFSVALVVGAGGGGVGWSFRKTIGKSLQSLC